MFQAYETAVKICARAFQIFLSKFTVTTTIFRKH